MTNCEHTIDFLYTQEIDKINEKEINMINSLERKIKDIQDDVESVFNEYGQIYDSSCLNIILDVLKKKTRILLRKD